MYLFLYVSSLKLFSKKYSILDNGSVLLINKVDENDVGRYECLAVSSFGETRASASLTVTQESSNTSNISLVNLSGIIVSNFSGRIGV